MVAPAQDASGVISYYPVDNLDTLWLQFICGSHSYGSWAKMPTPISNGLFKSLLGYLKNNSVLIYQKPHLRLFSHLQTSSLASHLLICSLFLLCLFSIQQIYPDYTVDIVYWCHWGMTAGKTNNVSSFHGAYIVADEDTK